MRRGSSCCFWPSPWPATTRDTIAPRSSSGAERQFTQRREATEQFIHSSRFSAAILALVVLLSPVAGIAPGSPIQLNRIAVIETATSSILTKPQGFDLDHDGKREFIIEWQEGVCWNAIFQIYESSADDTFTLVHGLNLDFGSCNSSYYPGDVGDADGDGLAELAVFGRTSNDYYVRLYESTSSTTYPSELVWEFVNGSGWPEAAKLADTDGDGLQEVVVAGRTTGSVARVVIHENIADDTYTETYYQAFPSSELSTPQSLEVAKDLDGDGYDEILFGGLSLEEGDKATVFGIESVGDNAYIQAWMVQLFYLDTIVNVSFIEAVGDLDGDGRREFLAGGLKPIVQPGDEFLSVLFIWEAVGNDQFEVVSTFVQVAELEGESSAAAADVDGDGRAEIIFGGGATVKIYQNTGDNTWQDVWSIPALNNYSVGAGDHDGDGKAEVIFQLGFSTTEIWEIDSHYAADQDFDSVVDAIDNCPLTANPDQTDADLDEFGQACDCDDADAATYPGALEVNDGLDNQCLGDLGYGVVDENSGVSGFFNPDDKNEYSWPAQPGATLYDVRRSDNRYFWKICWSFLTASTFWIDTDVPDPGVTFYYLNRPLGPSSGSWGQNSAGAERQLYCL